MTDEQVMTIATGETRPVVRWFDGGWFTCPWCGTPNPPEARDCDNPACWASQYATAEWVRAEQERITRAQAEREQRRMAAEAHAVAQQKQQEQRAALWAERTATATGRGACLTCLRTSRWETQPLYRRHRSPDFHTTTP
jgi:hypothetical protein